MRSGSLLRLACQGIPCLKFLLSILGDKPLITRLSSSSSDPSGFGPGTCPVPAHSYEAGRVIELVAMASVIVSPAVRGIDRHRKPFSLLFYRAVRDLKPVWMLEDMRTMESFYEEEHASQRIYSPSEALLYAIVHDHQAYAQYLLSRYPDEALAKPAAPFFCCPSFAPHTATAVRYDRRSILSLILQQSHRVPSPPGHADGGGCFHPEDGSTPLHLACELLRPEAALMLLGSGASPHARDRCGLTPLDVTLQKMREASGGSGGDRRRCLDHLLMFTPRLDFKMRAVLDLEPQRWSRELGEETYQYLTGRSPAPLVLITMQTIVRQLSPQSFPDSLHELPIPSSMKPPGLPLSQQGGRRLL